MPLYSYRCLECDSVFDVRHSYKESPKECPLCQATKFEKHLGTPLNTIKKKENKRLSKGEIVNDTIKETFNEIKKEKSRLSKRTYKTKK